MKYMYRVLAAAFFAAMLGGCANTVDEPKAEAAKVSPTSSADAGIEKNVESALAGESQLAGAKLDASVKDGAVTLKGTIKNDWLKYVAETTAKKVDGVKSVKNDIVVPD